MSLSFPAAVAIAACDAYVDRADLGTTNAAAKFTVYSGAVPASVNAALTGANVALVTMAMSNPAFGAAAENVGTVSADAAAEPVADVAAAASGVATFYRLFDRDNNPIWQGTVSEPNAGGDMELSSVNVITGVNVVVQSFIFRVLM